MVTLLSPLQKIDLRRRLIVFTRFNTDISDVKLIADSPHELKHRPYSVESYTIEWIEKYIHDGEVMLDIGACVGTYSLTAAKLYPKLTVYAIEPSYINFYSLCENILVNDLKDRMIPICCALADESTIEHLEIPHLTKGSAGSVIERYQGFKLKSVFRPLVPVYRLDDWVKFAGIEEIHHIKIDVDGLELPLLHGAKYALQNLGIKTICIEVSRESIADTRSHLEQYGYKVVENANDPDGTNSWNIVLARDK